MNSLRLNRLLPKASKMIPPDVHVVTIGDIVELHKPASKTKVTVLNEDQCYD